MPLEAATYISELNIANPAHSDALSAADSHMRLTKATLKTTFPNFTAAPLTSTQAQLDAAVAASVLGTAASRFLAGTAALPGLTPVGDPDTGMWAPSADSIAIATNGVSRLTVSAAGATASTPLTATTLTSTGAYSGGTGQLVPVGGSVLWFEDTLPAEGGYCWANGGTLNRIANPLLWARWGTKYGIGDGSTTFNVINLCEVVPVGQRAMGSAASRALLATGVLGAAAFGAAEKTLVTANLPAYTPAGTNSTSATNSNDVVKSTSGITSAVGGGAVAALVNGGNTIGNATVSAQTFTGTAQGGTSTAFGVVQPSMAVNYIIRIG